MVWNRVFLTKADKCTGTSIIADRRLEATLVLFFKANWVIFYIKAVSCRPTQQKQRNVHQLLIDIGKGCNRALLL